MFEEFPGIARGSSWCCLEKFLLQGVVPGTSWVSSMVLPGASSWHCFGVVPVCLELLLVVPGTALSKFPVLLG